MNKITDSTIQPTEQIDKINEIIDKGVFLKTSATPILYAWKCNNEDYFCYTKTSSPASYDDLYDEHGNAFNIPTSSKTVSTSRVASPIDLVEGTINIMIVYTDNTTYNTGAHRDTTADIPKQLVNYEDETIAPLLLTYKSASNDSPIIIKSTNIGIDDTVSENVYPPLMELIDKNNIRLGQIECEIKQTTNTEDIKKGINISFRKSGTEEDYSNIQVGFNSNGEKLCVFPNTYRVDGQWTPMLSGVISNYSLAKNASQTWTIEGLPNDGHKYLVYCSVTASGTNPTLAVYSNEISQQSDQRHCRIITLSGQSATFIIPIGTNRVIGFNNMNATNPITINYFRTYSCRRIGTNQ